MNYKKKARLSKFIHDFRREVDYKQLTFAIIVIILAYSLVVILNCIVPDNQIFKYPLISAVSTIASALVIFFVWELYSKKSFTKEIINLTDLNDNIVNSGIDQYYSNFRTDIDWNGLLTDQKELTLCITYGASFYKTQEEILKNHVQRGGKITIVVPDYRNPRILNSLAYRFSTNVKDVKNRIVEAIMNFSKLNANIYLFNGTYQSSYYKIGDEFAIMSFFSHSSGHSVPALLLGKNGNLYKYVTQEIADIISQSKKFEKIEDVKSRYRERILFIDTETGGTDPSKHSLLSIGLVVWDVNSSVVNTKEIFIKHDKYLCTEEAIKINNFNQANHELKAISFENAFRTIEEFCVKNFPKDYKIILAGHNVQFDINFLKEFFRQNNKEYDSLFSHRCIDTFSIIQHLQFADKLDTDITNSDEAFRHFGIEVETRHDALSDIIATVKLFEKLIEVAKS